MSLYGIHKYKKQLNKIERRSRDAIQGQKVHKQDNHAHPLYILTLAFLNSVAESKIRISK
jgi:hypothetical protein